MLPPVNGFLRSVSASLFALIGAANAWGQASQPDQILDQVDAFNGGVVLEMSFDDPNRTTDFSALLASGGKVFSACKLAANGVYCLETDGAVQVVRYWKDPQSQPGSSSALLDCNDATLGLAGAQPCTGMTVDLSGALWLAGRKTGPTYSLVKVVNRAVLQNGVCSGGWTALAGNPNLCANEYAAGLPLLTDLDSIDGDAAAAAVPAPGTPIGSGVLAVAGGNTAVFFPDTDPATPIPSPDFGAWGLANGEQLLSTSLLQVPVQLQSGDPQVRNYVLAMTSTGRILSKEALDPAPIVALPVFDVSPQPSITIDRNAWSASGCLGQTSCSIGGATLTAANAKLMGEKLVNGAWGLGVQGGASGNEVDIGEHLGVHLPDGYTVTAIQVLFLYNGPEFSDVQEEATITTTDAGTNAQRVYKLKATAENTATWTGAGQVASCGATSSAGTGCFLLTNPFPPDVLVSSVSFTASGNSTSDFAVGRVEAAVTGVYGIRTSFTSGLAYVSDRDARTVRALRPDSSALTALSAAFVDADAPDGILSTSPHSPDGLTVAPGNSLDLAECSVNCAFRTTQAGVVAASLNNVRVVAGSTDARVFEVEGIVDCRYAPQDCRTLLNGNPTPVSDDVARQELVAAGWIKCVDAPSCLEPARQLLNVKPQLPSDVTSQFDASGSPPNGLPPLYVSRQYRGQASNAFRFNAFFFKTATGVVFADTFGGEIDVSELTGRELGCEPPDSPFFQPAPIPNPTIADRLKWDVITTASETVRSVGGQYIDSITNVGCRNPTKISGGRLSLVPYNLEIAPDTYGPTIRSSAPSVTLKNDGVFARLTQSLYSDLRSVLDDYTCQPSNTPLTRTQCDRLRKLWSSGKQKLDKCVDAAFQPKASASNENCQSFRNQFSSYRQALPATAPGADPDNRLGEQKWRWDVIKHVFETRFLPSIPPKGYCRERTAPGYAGCPAP